MSDTDLIAQLRSDGSALCVEAAAEIQRLRDRLVAVETELATTVGSVDFFTREKPDEPFRIEHDIPPNAPR